MEEIIKSQATTLAYPIIFTKNGNERQLDMKPKLREETWEKR